MWILRRLKSLNLANKAALTAALLFVAGFLPLVYFSTVARATHALERMAQGSDALAPLPVKRRDEVGQMLRAFNALQAKIHDKNHALLQSKARFQNLFEHMTNGFALHEMIFDAQGVPSDYRFLEVNPAFELLTGITAQQEIGKTALQVMPDLEQH